MKAVKLITTILKISAASAAISCNSPIKQSSAAPAKLDEFRQTLDSLDLGCSFEAITAQIDDDTSSSKPDDKMAKTLSVCERAREQYAILLSKYDANHDGNLSSSEMAGVALAFKQAQKTEVDKNSDGVISDDEIKLWRAQNLSTRSDKLEDNFSSACSTLTKDQESCRELYIEKCRTNTASTLATVVDDKGGLNKDDSKKDDGDRDEKKRSSSRSED